MTTSEPNNGKQGKVSGQDLSDALASATSPVSGAGGLPSTLDLTTLTRLANEFMTALPASSQASESLLAGAGQSPALRNFAGLERSAVPTEADLHQLSSAAAGVSAIPSPAGMPSLPSAFSFLEDIRSLIPQSTGLLPPASMLPGMDTATAAPFLPGGSDFDSASRAISDAGNLANLSSPQIPGAVMHPNVAYGAATYDFEQQARQLFSPDVVPVLEPYGWQQSGLSNLNFGSGQFDVAAIKRDFPILQERVNGYPLIWLDNAATTQKPQAVIDRLNYFYSHENSNVHRAAHELAARSTDAYEAARESVRRFLNAPSVREIVFVRGATEAINLVAQSWGRQNIQKDDEVLITWLEHHANIVPWQMLCAEKGARLRVAPVDDHGQIILEEYERLLSSRTRLVSFAQVSNALGTVTPVDEMVAAAHRYGAKVLVDGAQAVSHMRVDVQEYDCDFYVFSGHKVFAPTGIGVLYGKSEVLDAMRPWQGGGNMIRDVTFEKTLYQPAPLRFEAGTGSIADAVGLGAAIDYLDRIGMHNVNRHENELMSYASEALQSIPGLHLIGTAPDKAGVLSFVMDGFTTEEISSALNQQGIAVRAGHHCAQPILRRFGVESTVRPSLALYNTCEDIDALIAAIWNLRQGRGPGPL